MVLYTAKPLLSLPTLLSLDPLPCYSKCDICTLCYVDMCQCVYVCVRVFFSTACVSCFRLGAEPFPMIGLYPVMSWRAQRWNEKAAVLPCSWLLVRVRFFTFLIFFLCGWRSLLIVSLGLVHFGFQLCLTADEKWTSSSPRVFRGNVFRQRECFLWKKRGCSIALYSSSEGTKLDFLFPQAFLCSSIAFFVFFFFPSSVLYLHP